MVVRRFRSIVGDLASGEASAAVWGAASLRVFLLVVAWCLVGRRWVREKLQRFDVAGSVVADVCFGLRGSVVCGVPAFSVDRVRAGEEVLPVGAGLVWMAAMYVGLVFCSSPEVSFGSVIWIWFWILNLVLRWSSIVWILVSGQRGTS